MLLPALILVGVLVQAGNVLDLDGSWSPTRRTRCTTQLLISVFVAAQAPALISRDLRFRTITLYLARPMRRTDYVLVRLASLTVGDLRADRRAAAADVRRRRCSPTCPLWPRDRSLPRRGWSAPLLLAALPGRPGGAGLGAHVAARARRHRGDRAVLVVATPWSARSRASRIGTEHTTRLGRGRRAVLAVHARERRAGLPRSTPPRRRRRRRPAPRWGCCYALATAARWCSARSARCWPATGRCGREHDRDRPRLAVVSATSSPSTTSR